MYTDSTLTPISDTDPYTASDGTKYPGNYPKDTIAGLVKVTTTAQPTDTSVIITGFTIDQTHTQVWSTRPKTTQELAADAANTQNVTDTTNAKAYAKLTALAAMTPAQVQTYIANNVATLADAKDALTTLAIAVSILARRL